MGVMNCTMKATIEIDNDVVSEERNEEVRPTLTMNRVIDANGSFGGWGPKVNQTIIRRFN